eukprot:12774664-Prorocentrum_lima.AAC.1
MLWDVSTSVKASRPGPLLISQMQGAARTYMVAKQETSGESFSIGGAFCYNGNWLNASGLQRVAATL